MRCWRFLLLASAAALATSTVPIAFAQENASPPATLTMPSEASLANEVPVDPAAAAQADAEERERVAGDEMEPAAPSVRMTRVIRVPIAPVPVPPPIESTPVIDASPALEAAALPEANLSAEGAMADRDASSLPLPRAQGDDPSTGRWAWALLAACVLATLAVWLLLRRRRSGNRY